MIPNPQTTSETVRAELEATRATFHALLASLTEENLRERSHNPGWTNGEILAHMTFGFIVVNVLLPMARVWGRFPKGSSRWFAWLLNAITRPFNWVNALGARYQSRIFNHERVGRVYDWVHASLLKQVDSIKEEEWQHGMHYPTQWDPNFDEFMTLEKLFHYPVVHFNFHLDQIAR